MNESYRQEVKRVYRSMGTLLHKPLLKKAYIWNLKLIEFSDAIVSGGVRDSERPCCLPLIGGKFGVHHGCLTDHSIIAGPLPGSSQSLYTLVHRFYCVWQGGGSGQAVNGTSSKNRREKTWGESGR